MGDEKCVPYNNVKWKKSWGKQNEPLPTTPKDWSSSKEPDVSVVELKGGPLLWVPSGKQNG